MASTREAFQIAVRHSLDMLISERKAEINVDLDHLASEIIDTHEFALDFEEMLEEHLIIYGENYGI
jgi:hypothetical protein